MPKTSRRRALIAVTSLGGVVAAACGQQAASTKTGTNTTASGAEPLATRFARPVAIDYWKSLEGPRHDAQVKLTDDFNNSRTDVHVTLTHVGAYAQAAEKLTAALAASTTPDVMLLTVDSFGPNFARIGALSPLDDFLKTDKAAQAEKYVQGFIKDSQINGKTYQIPFARSTPLLYFNKDHFKAAGLPETAPSTWQDLQDLSQKLVHAGVMQPFKDDQGNETRFAFAVQPYWWTFQSMIWAFNGRFSDENFNVLVNSPQAVESMQYLTDMANRSRVGRGYKDSGGSAQTDFVQGRLSLFCASTANLSQIEQDGSAFRVGAAFMPAFRTRAVPGGGSGLAVLNASSLEKKQAGWEFIKWMTNTPNTVYWSQQTGYMPVRSDAADNATMKDFLAQHPNAKVTLDQAQYIKADDPIVGAPMATNMIEAAMAKAIVQQAPAKDIFEQLANDLKQAAGQVKR